MPSSLTVQETAIHGVRRFELVPNDDSRGRFTEFYREEWSDAPRPLQFNVVHSQPRVFRGIHVHFRFYDWFVLVAGRSEYCLGDLRESSPTFGRWEIATLDAQNPSALLIPPGVAHGFHFPVASTHVYGVSEYWCPEEEMGCHWADPSLGLVWTDLSDPILSERDAALGTLGELRARLAPYQHLLQDARSDLVEP